jgi:hypothetical protein
VSEAILHRRAELVESGMTPYDVAAVQGPAPRGLDVVALDLRVRANSDVTPAGTSR